ncbi:hypothetical protein BS50DRAFT_208190 [Corynespora cassiicola Philippines]|uniref:Uncharacterized protein n=1 Tax=Corynespora cassiicola Philippines TaxID=1448308 RepID=A0A2T2N4J3_CORCC|nr:hypothetical protein BS50DRAFT_208190 [Corynespora cassiicola Philippines]
MAMCPVALGGKKVVLGILGTFREGKLGVHAGGGGVATRWMDEEPPPPRGRIPPATANLLGLCRTCAGPASFPRFLVVLVVLVVLVALAHDQPPATASTADMQRVTRGGRSAHRRRAANPGGCIIGGVTAAAGRYRWTLMAGKREHAATGQNYYSKQTPMRRNSRAALWHGTLRKTQRPR